MVKTHPSHILVPFWGEILKIALENITFWITRLRVSERRNEHIMVVEYDFAALLISDVNQKRKITLFQERILLLTCGFLFAIIFIVKKIFLENIS